MQDFEAFLLNCSHSWNFELSITIIPDAISFQSLPSKHNWNNGYLIVSEIEQTLIFKHNETSSSFSTFLAVFSVAYLNLLPPP